MKPTTSDVIAAMRRVELFQDLTEEQLARLAVGTHMLSVDAHTNLMALDQPAETMYAILTGTVRVQVEQEGGKLVILAFLRAGDVVGEMGVLEPVGRSATVLTIEPCELIWLDRATLESAILTMPKLAMNLVSVVTRRLRLANERIQILASLDAAGRVARQLDAFATSFGKPTTDGTIRLSIRLTQSDLADIVGASRERVNQVMVDFKRLGLIAMDGAHHIIVLDRAKLARRY